jgi:hypothetical protein
VSFSSVAVSFAYYFERFNLDNVLRLDTGKICVFIHTASIQYQDGAKLVLQNIKERCWRLKVILQPV